mgnify:CR=1 FL=1
MERLTAQKMLTGLKRPEHRIAEKLRQRAMHFISPGQFPFVVGCGFTRTGFARTDRRHPLRWTHDSTQVTCVECLEYMAHRSQMALHAAVGK